MLKSVYSSFKVQKSDQNLIHLTCTEGSLKMQPTSKVLSMLRTIDRYKARERERDEDDDVGFQGQINIGQIYALLLYMSDFTI